MTSETPRPWKLLASEPGPDLIILQARFDTFEHPRSGAALRRLVVDAPTWVNVVARTPEGDFVLVRQFRFGTREVTLEIPGGLVDAGEDPAETARRELLEETGYSAGRLVPLATIEPNPAFQSNLCRQFLAEDCVRTHEPALDPGEDIAVELMSADQVRAAVRDGAIRHSLALCGLAWVLDISRVAP